MTCQKTFSSFFFTLTEIQQHLYANDSQRCPRSVLRLHNLTFVDAIMLNTLTEIKSMSSRKFRGKYPHNLIVHDAMQNRIVSGATTHVESKERAFNAVKSITSSTSSNRPEHVIGNLFVRLQIEQNASKVITGNDKSEVAELYSMITKVPNTFIPFEYIATNPGKWQAHLKRISDFLLAGPKVWWKETEKGLNSLIQKRSLTHILKVPYCIIFAHRHCKVRTSIPSNVYRKRHDYSNQYNHCPCF